ncbi:helix-turn-helix domain-containing protein [Acidicapsa acidisoli]|uniref:helix-turn-helix domain-containing protein n=1 Tax=Acidicapsa acidisoli TaxID=1615681 RepID=UPI0021E03551|nr:AraC family transcriptional regulator [Acidicapsa acidisoli]
MFYRRYTPPPPLSAFVDCMWYSEGFEGTHQRERLLPNGESGIVFDLREEQPVRNPVRIFNPQNDARFETFAPAIFCGARTDCFVIETSQQERVIGIQFRPGGAFPFLSMPASEVANATYSLDDIWPGQAASIRDALMNACDFRAMFSILERALLARLRNASPLHPAIAFAIARLARPSQSGENVRVGDIADRVGFSSRRFMELFRQQTGLAPKSFQRVRRFQRVLQTLRAESVENWADVAYRCGYYDQPHFIHDFRMFSGLTPGEYVAVATPHLNHVPLT